MRKLRPEEVVAGGLIVLGCGVLLFASCSRARADVVTVRGECTTPAPCTQWTFQIPALPANSSAALYLTGYDFDSPTEGTFTLGGEVVPLFGPEAGPAFNDPDHASPPRTIGYQVNTQTFLVGSMTGLARWTSDTANDPRKHEITAAALQFAALPEWLGPVVYVAHGPDRVLYGFCSTLASVRTAYAIEYSPALAVRLDALRLQFKAGQSLGFDLSFIKQIPLQPGDAALLWAPERTPPACK